MGALITSIGTATPALRIPQSDISAFMTENILMEADTRKQAQVLFRAAGITHRHTVLEDYSKSKGEFSFFPNSESLEPFPGVADRMEIYRSKAVGLSLRAIHQCDLQKPSSITHLVTVSCTGMYAPGLDFDLVKELGLSKSVKRTSVNFMGCYAAFTAMKMANDFCTADQKARVLVVCVELCSLHFQKKTDTDTLLANALFADGAAALIVENTHNQIALEFSNFHCDLLTDGEKEMTWGIGDFGFEMTLSSYVPELIKKGIRSLIDNLLVEYNLSPEEIEYFAIHPGGKKILEVVEEELRIPKERNAPAHEILRNYGNMSSPTVLFVLNSIMERLTESDSGSNILSLAFGPGLTLESALLKVR